MRSLVSARGALAGLLGTTLASAGLVLAAPAALAGPVPDGGACATANVCDLWADEGGVTLPGAAPVTVPVWSYSAAAGPATSAVGPTLVVEAGVPVTLTVHNDLAEPTTLALPQVPGWNDRTPIAPGGSHAYQVTFDTPGSYLYEAGSSGPADGARQVAMGMAGAIVVRPAAGAVEPLSLDGTAATRFDDEAVLVLSEVDPAFNANPSAFDLRSFAPRYRLINGKAHPDTTPVATAAGRRLLLRTLNVGLLEHSLGALGLRQTIVGLGSHPLAQPYDVFAETAQPGQSIDSLVSIDAAPAPSYPLYETAAGSGVTTLANFGGMLTSITTGATVTPKPTVTGLAVTPLNQPLGAAAIVPTFGLIPPSATAEYQFDGAGGWLPVSTGTSLSVVALGNGSHTIAVHAVDGAITGPAASAVFNLDGAGPVISALTATPGYSNGSTPLTIGATGSETSTGGSNVAAGTFSITGPGILAPLTGNLTRNQAAPVAALTGTQPLSTLGEGVHTVSVTATDELGNASAVPAATTFTVDRTGPSLVDNVVIAPATNNGTDQWRTGTGTFLVSADVTDNFSAGGAEGFFNTLGTAGTGFAMLPANANATGPKVTMSVEVPLSELTALADGAVPVQVRGRDSAGQWGGSGTGSFVLDRVGPAITAAITLAPNPTRGGVTTITAPVSNAGTATVGVDYAVISSAGTTIAAGSATATAPVTGAGTLSVPLDTATLPDGTFTLSVRARSAAGSIGAARTVPITVNNRIRVNGFDPTASPFGWTSRVGTSITRVTTAAAGAIAGPSGQVNFATGGVAGYVLDNNPTGETSYHAGFQLRPQNTPTQNTAAGPVLLFQGTTTDNNVGAAAFQVQYQRAGSGASVTSQVRLVSGPNSTSWVTVSSGTGTGTGRPITTVRLDWAAAGQATLTLTGTGVSTPAPQSVTAAGTVIGSVSLGRFTTVNNSALGSVVVDTFDSARTHLPS